jgi:CTP synthase (UTP-ammonia lyase)
MSTALTVGIIGDYNPHSKYHLATNAALQHAAQALGISLAPVWLPTPSLEEPAALAALDRFDALWCSPGSPYDSMQGALNAIQFAREKDRPFVGT